MKRLIASIILLCFSLQVNGQQRVSRAQQDPIDFDGFRSRISTIENPDSLLTQYVLFARGIVVRGQPGSILPFIDEIMMLEEVDPFKKRAYKNYLLSTYWDRPNPDSSLKYAERAANLFEQIGNKDLMLELMVQQARLKSRLDEYLASESLYLEILEFQKANAKDFEFNNNDEERILNELTDLYIRVGAVDLALDRYNQLLELEPISLNRECSILMKISNAYRRNKEVEVAKEKLVKCDNAESIDMGLRLAIMRNISTLDTILGNKAEAVERLEKVIEIEAESRRQNPMSFLALARAYEDNTQYEKVRIMLRNYENNGIERTPPFARISYYYLKAESLMRDESYNEALKSVDLGLALAKNMLPTPHIRDGYNLKAEILEKLGDYQGAYEVVKYIDDASDELEERTRISEESIAKVRLQMRAKNDELADVTSQLGTVKTRNALIIFGLVFIALYIIYRYRVYFLLREERARNRIARDLHDDLSGTLSSISFFSEAAKREHEDVNRSGKFLEKIDESAIEAKEKINDIIWAIDPENDDWTAFLTKCRRFAAEMFESKGISYDIDIDPNIDLPLEMKNRNDLWLIFKEIITNLVRHSKATEAKVIIKLEKSKLILYVEDNGVGFDTNDRQHGNGIFNIKKRITSISQGNDITLNSSSDEGTKWEIKFIF